MKDTTRRLMPQSWGDVAIWAVLGVIFITHPVESSRFVGRVVWGTGTWISYQTFADCGTPPPYEWMGTKACDTTHPAPTSTSTSGSGSGSEVAPSVAPTGGMVPPGGVPVDGGPGSYQGETYGLRLPTPDRTWAELHDLHDGIGTDIIRTGSGT